MPLLHLTRADRPRPRNAPRPFTTSRRSASSTFVREWPFLVQSCGLPEGNGVAEICAAERRLLTRLNRPGAPGPWIRLGLGLSPKR